MEYRCQYCGRKLDTGLRCPVCDAKRSENMAELKPCPFDGCTSCTIAESNNAPLNYTTVYKIYYVYCPFCGAVGSPRPTKQQAIEAWNKRS